MKRKLMLLVILALIIFPIIFLALYRSNLYTVQKAINNNDFITYPEQININLFNTFINDINNNKDTKIRITEFSKEGKPKVNDIFYSNKKITLRSFYPNNLLNKEDETQVFTNYMFENNGDFFLINASGDKEYICQVVDY